MDSTSVCGSRRPLRVMFCITSMPVGGAEVLMVNLVRGFDPERIVPQICCLKEPGVLGEEIGREFPLHHGLIDNKWDISVVGRLKQLMKEQAIDAVVTVGAGDKMFWGRLAARYARVPVVLSALHSTGWPDGVGRLNRMLTRITDGFIAVAESHGRFLVEYEKFPPEKVFVIPNGVDTERFRFCVRRRQEWRQQLGINDRTPAVGIVAALRPEKNHEMFLRAARAVRQVRRDAVFVVAGDGPCRHDLEKLSTDLGLLDSVRFVGSISDTPGLLSAIDVFALTSHNEASPVSILEAMACGRPVVAPQVGSISDSVQDGRTGYLIPKGDTQAAAERWLELLGDPDLRAAMGRTAREFVCHSSSLETMTDGYTTLIESLFRQKRGREERSGDEWAQGRPDRLFADGTGAAVPVSAR